MIESSVATGVIVCRRMQYDEAMQSFTAVGGHYLTFDDAVDDEHEVMWPLPPDWKARLVFADDDV